MTIAGTSVWSYVCAGFNTDLWFLSVDLSVDGSGHWVHVTLLEDLD